MAVTAPADEVHRVISTAFDPVFYRAVNPELLAPDFDPLRHYLSAGWREGRDPAPWFSVEAYLRTNADVRRLKTEPLHHFLTIGRHEGREVVPSPKAEAYLAQTQWSPEPWSFEALIARPLPPPPPALASAPEEPAPVEVVSAQTPADDEVLAATEFDVAYYLAANPDVAAAGTDPLRHFLVAGWREGRDPSRRFSVRDYLEINPDVAQAGINPFVHYLRAGRAEGRIARHDLGFRYEVLSRLSPPEARLAAAAEATAALKTDTAKSLALGLAGARTGLKDLHVTFSHDDFAANFGGVQLCLQRESARLADAGIDHLHLHPAVFWPALREGEPGALGVLLNGKRLGVFTPAAVRSGLAKAAGAVKAGRRSFAIHNLLGHSADETADLLEALGMTEGFFWVHDFASLCAGFHLLRNDVEDCAAPPPDSPACTICAYGRLRARHLDAHRRLFERLALTVVSPSQTTLDFWRSSWDFPARDHVVLPHARLVDRGPAPAAAGKRRRFRVAFVGMPVPLKGWPIFRALADRYAGDKRYEFLHLGGQGDPSTPAAFHPVIVGEDRPRAMQEALEALEVDAALIWPLCRETFSFTAYEAAAAGAAVITGPDSGNVAAFVTETGLGRVLADEAALVETFATGEILALRRGKRKARLHDLAFSGLTVDLLRDRA